MINVRDTDMPPTFALMIMIKAHAQFPITKRVKMMWSIMKTKTLIDIILEMLMMRMMIMINVILLLESVFN